MTLLDGQDDQQKEIGKDHLKGALIPSINRGSKKKMNTFEHHYSRLPELRKRAMVERKDSIDLSELDMGIYSLVDRGLILPGDDVTKLVQVGSRLSKLPNLRFTQGNNKVHVIVSKSA